MTRRTRNLGTSMGILVFMGVSTALISPRAQKLHYLLERSCRRSISISMHRTSTFDSFGDTKGAKAQDSSQSVLEAMRLANRQRKYDSTVQLFESMIVPPTSEVANLALEAVGRLGDNRRAFAMLQDFSRENLSTDDSYSHAALASAASSDWNGVVDVVEFLDATNAEKEACSTNNVKMKLGLRSLAVRAYAKLGNWRSSAGHLLVMCDQVAEKVRKRKREEEEAQVDSTAPSFHSKSSSLDKKAIKATSPQFKKAPSRQQRVLIDLRLVSSVVSCCAASPQSERSSSTRGKRETPHSSLERAMAVRLPFDTALEVVLRVCHPTMGLNVTPDTFVANSLISACDKAGEWQFALEILEVLTSSSFLTSYSSTSASLSKPLKKTSSMSSRESVNFSDGVQRSSLPRPQLYSEILNLFASHSSSRVLRVDGRSFNAALSACGRAGRMNEVLRLISLHPRLDTVAVNTLMMATLPSSSSLSSSSSSSTKTYFSVSAADWSTAIFVLSKMGTGSPVASAFLLTNGDEGLYQEEKGSIERALAKNKKSIDSIRPDTISYNTALQACALAGQWDVALALLDEMSAIEAGKLKGDVGTPLSNTAAAIVSPDERSFSCAISACGRSGQWERALKLLEDMQSSRYRAAPNTAVCNAALSACEQSGRWKEACDLLRDMKIGARGLVGCEPDEISFTTAIRACKQVGGLERSVELVEELQRQPSLQVGGFQYVPTTSTDRPRTGEVETNNPFNGVGDENKKYMKADKGKAQLSGMIEIEADHAANGIRSAKGAETAADPSATFEFKRTLFPMPTAPPTTTGTIKSPTSLHNSSSSSSSSNLLWERGVEMIGYAAAIKAYHASGEGLQAVALLQEMLHRGLTPDRVTFNTCIAACALGGQWQRVLSIMHTMSTISSEERTRASSVSSFASPLPSYGVDALWDVVTFNSAMDACVKIEAIVDKNGLEDSVVDTANAREEERWPVRDSAAAVLRLWMDMLSSSLVEPPLPSSASSPSRSSSSLASSPASASSSSSPLPTTTPRVSHHRSSANTATLAVSTLPRPDGVLPDEISFRVLIESLDRRQQRRGGQRVAKLTKRRRRRKPQLAALSFASALKLGHFQNLFSAAHQHPSSFLYSGQTGLLWIPPKLGLLDLHGLSVAQAEAATRYALTLIASHGVAASFAMGEPGEDTETSCRQQRGAPSTAAAALSAVRAVVGAEGLTVVTGHGQSREDNAKLPTAIRTLCRRGLVTSNTPAIHKEKEGLSWSANYEEVITPHQQKSSIIDFVDLDNNEGAFVIPLESLLTFMDMCHEEWTAVLNDLQKHRDDSSNKRRNSKSINDMKVNLPTRKRIDATPDDIALHLLAIRAQRES